MLEDIQKHLNKIMEEQNNRPVPEFEGYSPKEMHHIIHFAFELNSPIRFRDELSSSDFAKIPLFNLVKYLGSLLQDGEIKLTKIGFLPTKIVKDVYSKGFKKEWHIEKGVSKVYKEADCTSVNLPRLIMEIAGITKKRNGKLRLTKNGQKLLTNDFELLQLIIRTYATKFNWAYYDGYGDNQVGQMGFGYSLILLSKYGNELRSGRFYADKYYAAFPQFYDLIESPNYGTKEDYMARNYSLRTFDRFLDYLGLVDVVEEGKSIDKKTFYKKSDLFDKVIKCALPNSVN